MEQIAHLHYHWYHRRGWVGLYRSEKELPPFSFWERGTSGETLWQGEKLYLKVYPVRSVAYSLYELFVWPRPFRALFAALKVWQRGVFTPLPEAAVWNLWRRQSYLLTPVVSGWCLLRDMSEFSLIRLVLWLGELHRKGVFHGDFKPHNLLFHPCQNTFGLLDLDQTKVSCAYQPHLAAKDWCSLIKYFPLLQSSSGQELWQLYSQAVGDKKTAACRYRLRKRLRQRRIPIPCWLH